jgi:hypothetical protein
MSASNNVDVVGRVHSSVNPSDSASDSTSDGTADYAVDLPYYDMDFLDRLEDSDHDVEDSFVEVHSLDDNSCRSILETPTPCALNFIKFDETKILPQAQSPLFDSFPGEIRDLIFYHALCDYEDKSKLYDENTCYRRPGYFAPRHTDTALLRTCQRVYREAWFLPWTTREHTLFLTAPERCPVRTISELHMRSTLNLVNSIHGKTEIDHIRVFPQLYRLEPGVDLQRINNWHHFHPRRFTITIRHTDWWHWETDTPLWIDSRFVNKCRFPESVKELHFELESLERRKEQINSIAKQMMDKWQFQRKDGVRLSAKDSAVSITRWSGSSTWSGQRWIRDETGPETLDYYVATIVFKPMGNDPRNEKEFADYRAPKLEVSGFKPIVTPHAYIPSTILEAAKIPPGTAAAETTRLWHAFNSGSTRLPIHRRDNLSTIFTI